jgi:hypothetical protein
MIVALAGRRVDFPDIAEMRLPPQNVDKVRERIREFLKANHASVLVCAAACGADLLALEAAGDLRIRRHIVLPCTRDVFRRTSVADRPGDWGERYDRIIEDVDRQGDLLELDHCSEGDRAYAAANRAVLNEAVRIASSQGEDVRAVLVWDGKAKSSRDYTQLFGADARALRLKVDEIPTL